jgi:hypothetical protein
MLTRVKRMTYLKIARPKRARGMTSVVEQLPSRHEALSSNFNTTKKVYLVDKCFPD